MRLPFRRIARRRGFKRVLLPFTLALAIVLTAVFGTAAVA